MPLMTSRPILPRLMPALLLPLLALPGAADADLTAAGLWTDWQSAAASRDITVAAEEVTEIGDGLLLTGVTARLMQQDDATVTAEIPLVTLSELGDGQVQIAFPEGQRIAFEQTGDTPMSAVLAIDTAALTVTASGTPAETDYAWLAPMLSVTLEEFDPGDEPLEADLSVTARDLSGRLTGYDAQLDGPITAVFEAAETAWSFGFTDPAADATMNTEASQSDVVLQAESIGLSPEGTPGDDARLRLAFDAGSGMSRSTQSFEGETQLSETSHDSASFRVDMTPEEAFYTGAGAGVSVTLDGPALPVRPIIMAIEELDMAFVGPVADADTPQPFDLTLEVINLMPDASLWAQLDPGEALPRVPVTLEADLEGQALLGPAARIPAMPAGSSPEFAPTELTVNRIDLSYGDSSAKATGAFTFPAPSDAAVPLSQPQPEGALDVTLTGIPELLGLLSQSGLLQQQQMMAAQMMLGMFTAPQPDGTMTSRIESRSDGSLFVNGNQMR